jgi:hypothetical protein
MDVEYYRVQGKGYRVKGVKGLWIKELLRPCFNERCRSHREVSLRIWPRPPNYGVNMTKCRAKKLFSLFRTVFAIWKHLEAFGYWLFSLFCTVLTLKRQISENSELLQMLPKIIIIIFGSIWKFYCFRWFVFSVSNRCKIAKTVSIQMLPNASK